MSNENKHPPLTAYRIIVEYEGGARDSYVTNCAWDIDLSDAKSYFMGQRQEISERSFRTVVGVEEVTGPVPAAEIGEEEKLKWLQDNGYRVSNLMDGRWFVEEPNEPDTGWLVITPHRAQTIEVGYSMLYSQKAHNKLTYGNHLR